MKTYRLMTFILIFVIAFSAWTPSPALARETQGAAGAAKTKFVSLTVVNRTFGALLVTLEGSGGSYSFFVVEGKHTYQIRPGKYTYTVHFAANSICKGWLSTKYGDYLVKTRSFINLKNTLGPYRYCNLK